LQHLELRLEMEDLGFHQVLQEAMLQELVAVAVVRLLEQHLHLLVVQAEAEMELEALV
jgi:hypothetical protein